MSDVLMTREALEAEVLRWRDEAEQQRARAEMAEAERDDAVRDLHLANAARDALEGLTEEFQQRNVDLAMRCLHAESELWVLRNRPEQEHPVPDELPRLVFPAPVEDPALEER